MTIPDIHNAFNDLLEAGNLQKIRQRRAIGLSGRAASWYRWQNARGRLGIQTKINWLKRAGIDTGSSLEFNRADMIEFLEFSRRKDSQRSVAALGDEYLFDKFLVWRSQGKPAVISTGV
jgi:hypothetical protein